MSSQPKSKREISSDVRAVTGSAEEQWFRSLFTRTTSAIARLDIGGRVIECNAAVNKLTGHPAAEIEANGLSILFRPDTWMLVEAGFEFSNEDDGYVVEASIVHAEGHEIAVMVGITPATVDEDLVGHFVIIRDMTGQKRALDALNATLQQLREARDLLEVRVEERTRQLVESEARLAHQAFYDSLTELPNRGLFLERLELAIASRRRESRRVAVVFADLDNFKTINDSLGHEAGDILLKIVAQRLQACVRAGDTVARLSGDEFTLLLTNVADDDEAFQVAERARLSLTESVNIFGQDVPVTASMGVAVATDEDRTAADLLRNADIAMYESKAHGKASSTLFARAMRDRVMERLAQQASNSRQMPPG